MILPDTVNNQAYIFLCAVAGGMVIAFLYDIFRIRRKALRTNIVVVYIEDLIYWILVALVMFGVTFYSNDGELRGFIFLGSAIGVILYISLMSRLIVGSAMLVIGIICRVFKLLWTIVAYPFKIVYRVLRIPGRFIGRGLRKLLRSTKHAAKNKIGRHFNLRRAIRNIIKKF